MRLNFLPLFLLALPFLEIAGFVVVGSQVGVLVTLGLVVASGVLGALLLRVQGFGIMARIRKEIEAGQDPGREVANGAMILLAGILLLIPGFVSDILGLLLLLPPVRGLAWRFLKSRVVVSQAGFGGFTRPGAGKYDRQRGKTIDLDADEYNDETPQDARHKTRHETRPDTPWRRIDRE